MSVGDQFRSLTDELHALKNRVRDFTDLKQWQADGEWKELVLRSVLSRHLPRTLEPLRGFVTNGWETTTQIDVLIYDNSHPCLFRAGDFVVITPDATAGIVEVKSSVRSPSTLGTVLTKLGDSIERIRAGGREDAFAGLFAFDSFLTSTRDLVSVVSSLQQAQKGSPLRTIDLVCLGKDFFVLYWEGAEGGDLRWRAYHLQDMAPAYFVNNVIFSVDDDSVRRNMPAWFPARPKVEVVLDEGPLDLGFATIEGGSKDGTR